MKVTPINLLDNINDIEELYLNTILQPYDRCLYDIANIMLDTYLHYYDALGQDLNEIQNTILFDNNSILRRNISKSFNRLYSTTTSKKLIKDLSILQDSNELVTSLCDYKYEDTFHGSVTYVNNNHCVRKIEEYHLYRSSLPINFDGFPSLLSPSTWLPRLLSKYQSLYHLLKKDIKLINAKRNQSTSFLFSKISNPYNMSVFFNSSLSHDDVYTLHSEIINKLFIWIQKSNKSNFSTTQNYDRNKNHRNYSLFDQICLYCDSLHRDNNATIKYVWWKLP